MRRMLERMVSSWRLSTISRLASTRAFWRSGRLSSMRMLERASLITAVISASRLARGFAEIARQHLARGIFSKADRGEKILDTRQTIIRREILQIFVRNFFQAAGEIARLVLQ